MVQFNFSERTIKAKVVYYGPPQSGKTTNLEQIHRITDPEGSNRLIALNTAQDRTLFFDLLPFSLGAVSGYDFKIQLYTVPGQVQYNATRRVVLAGADAVVFVADARKSMLKENQASFENMKVNLLANRLVPDKVPLVVQYNKQDLPDRLSETQLLESLNPWSRRGFAAVAMKGEGVVETFSAVVEAMLASIAVKYNLKEKGLDPATVPLVVKEAFAKVLVRAKTAAASVGRDAQVVPAPVKIVLSDAEETSSPAGTEPSVGESGLVSEDLLHRSIRSNVELAETLADLLREMNLGLGAILSHAELFSIYREDAHEKRAGALAEILREATRLRQRIQEMGARAAPASEAVVLATPATSGFGRLLQDRVAQLWPQVAAHGLRFEWGLSEGVPVPQMRSADAEALLDQILQGFIDVLPQGSRLFSRSERKPVTLRTREGDATRDFVIWTLAHADPGWSAELLQRLTGGQERSAVGQAIRRLREFSGFVRFTPLAAGRIETRFFFPG